VTVQLDRFLERDSPLHRADARLKFVATVAFILSLSLLPVGSFAALGIGLVAVWGASLLARISPLRMVRGSLIAGPFMFAAFPLVFTKPGDPLFDIPFGLFDLTASGEGVRHFLTIFCKTAISVQAAVLLTFTTKFHDLIEGLRQLGLPLIFVGVISFMYRYLAVLTGEASRMMRARAARSARLADTKDGGSVVWRAKVVGSMVGSLFLRAYERSERVYDAMRSRGYDGQLMTLSHRGSLQAVEWVTLGSLLAVFAAYTLAAFLWLPHA
jgi:cobalt/nickel transport system permease protein